MRPALARSPDCVRGWLRHISIEAINNMVPTVRVHQNLSRIFTRKGTNAQSLRAYNYWNILRQEGMQSTYSIDWVVSKISGLTGLHPDNVRKSIRAGVELGLFTWDTLYGRIPAFRIVGKDRVFERYLNNLPPGKVVVIKTELLLDKSYQQLRAVYHHNMFGDKPRTISRAVQSNITEFTEQTTRNWTARLKSQGKVFVKSNYYEATSPYSKNEIIIKQAPNTFIDTGLWSYDNSGNPAQSWDARDRILEGRYNPTDKPHTKNQKRYFADKESAEAAYTHRVKKSNKSERPIGVVDTFYPGTLIVDGRNYNTWLRVRPYKANEIPEDVMIRDIEAYDTETRKMEAAGMFDEPNDTPPVMKLDKYMELSIHMLNSVNVPLKKPRKTYNKTTRYVPPTELTEVQRIELMLNPELSILL